MNMAAYKDTIRRRLRWAWVEGIALVAIVAGATWYSLGVVGVQHPDDHLLGFRMGVQTGLFLAILLLVIVYSVRYARALRSDSRLEAMYIEETDERNRFIQDKIGGVGYNAAMILMAVGVVVSGFFDGTVFFTLLAATAAMAFLKAGLKVYYSRKI